MLIVGSELVIFDLDRITDEVKVHVPAKSIRLMGTHTYILYSPDRCTYNYILKHTLMAGRHTAEALCRSGCMYT